MPTASGDNESYIVRFYRRFTDGSCEPSHLELFRRKVRDLTDFDRSQDVIYVGGGNVANLLAVWKVHAFDVAIRAAYENGTVVAGVSAGSLCWFQCGVTDSMGDPDLSAIDCLIAMAVTSEARADECIGPLRALGYEYLGVHGNDPARRFYVLQDAGRRLVHIQLYILPAHGWCDMLRFRDALRSQPELRAAYAAEKQRVAASVGWNREAYSEAKGPFIRGVLDALNKGAPCQPACGTLSITRSTVS